jgi:hypothetical protein
MRATFSERLGKITGDQLETLYFLNDFLTQTGGFSLRGFRRERSLSYP